MSREPIAQPETPEWHALRSQGFGASEAAAVAGLSQYETPLHVYLRKRGELPAVEETKPMRRGKRWEPFVLDTFSEETGLEISQSPCGLYRHESVPFVLATPDAILTNGELVDAKTTTFRQAAKFGAEGSDELPVEYVCQGQQQLAVMGAEVCHFAVMLDVWTLRVFRVERNDELIDGLIEAERELWDRIQSGSPPAPTWGHARTLDLVKQMHGAVGEGYVSLSAEAVAAWERRRELSKLIREAEKECDELKARVLHEIGERYAGVLPAGRMIRRKRIVAEVEAHTKDFIDAREVKLDQQVIMSVASAVEIVTEREELKRFAEAHALLTDAGFEHVETSDSGSRYYVTPDGGERVRVASHAANVKTRGWIDRRGVHEIRIDMPGLVIAEAVEAILSGAVQC